jgi:hypothetical protein
MGEDRADIAWRGWTSGCWLFIVRCIYLYVQGRVGEDAMCLGSFVFAMIMSGNMTWLYFFEYCVGHFIGQNLENLTMVMVNSTHWSLGIISCLYAVIALL